MTLEDDAQQIRLTGRALAELGSTLGPSVDDRLERDLAQPLADTVRRSWAGPWARALAGGTSTEAGDGYAAVTVGGSARVVSGGASVSQLVYGSLYGGSGRQVNVSRRTRRGRASYKLRAGSQFDRHNRDTLTPAIDGAGAQLDAALLDIADDVLREALP